MYKYLIAIIIFLSAALFSVLIWGGLTNWKFITPSSPISQVIQDFPHQLTTTNECNPSRGCNVCDDCCKSYIPDGAPCDGCVAEKCNPCKPDSTGKCGKDVCRFCCNPFIGQEQCASCVTSVCQACRKNGVMGSDGKCVCNQEYPDCINHNEDKADCLLSSDKFGNKVCQYNSDNTCTSKTKWMGPTCQYSRELTCNSRGNVDDNGVCTCDAGYAGKNCEYSRKDCNSHGNPSWDGKTLTCICDSGWNGSTCTGIEKVSDQGFSNPGIGADGNCENAYLCPWTGVTLNFSSCPHGKCTTGEDIGQFKNCIRIQDNPAKGPEVKFTATGANGKTDSYTVQKDCCGIGFFCLHGNTQSLSVTGGSNYVKWAADDTTPGGMVIGMPL